MIVNHNQVYMEEYNYIVAWLPHELVAEILKKLPAMSLMRFKCVSKSFCAFISDPYFIESHQKSYVTQFLVNHPRMSYYSLSKSEKRDEELATCPLQYLDQPCFHDLVSMQTTNGLVCLWNQVGDVAICNPFINQHVFLPCQQRNKTSIYAIGFDPTTKIHKVFKAAVPKDDNRLIYSIFTIGIDKSWREISGTCTKFCPTNDNCVCIDGVIYFVNDYYASSCDIVAFSVGDEKFIRRIPFPIKEWPLRFFEFSPRIVEIKGQVALLGHVYFEKGTIVLYILNGTSEREPWVKHTIKLPLEFTKIVDLCYLLTTNPKGDIVSIPDLELLTTNPKGDIVSIPDLENSPLFLYDIEKKEWRIVAKQRIYEQKFIVKINGLHIYLNLVESIWSLK